MKSVQVRYFALFREQAGRAAETVELAPGVETARDLFEALCARHALAEGLRNAKVAINDEIAAWTSPVRDGDTVLFFPPVSGG